MYDMLTGAVSDSFLVILLGYFSSVYRDKRKRDLFYRARKHKEQFKHAFMIG